MNKMQYYFKRLFNLNYKIMIKTIKKVSRRSNKSSVLVFFDILICSVKYGSGYVDYDLFSFENLSHKQRKTFITRSINNEYIKKLNNRTYYNKFDNKVIFNKIYKNFVKRDFLDLSLSSYEEFLTFIDNHKVFIAKPVDKSGGEGVVKVEIENIKKIDSLYNKLKSNKQTLLEEYIYQSDEMNKLFPNAVNTIRVVTLRVNDKTHIVHRVIRIGSGENVVDNFHKGGMYSIIDECGIITHPAIDREGNIHNNHPVTGTKIEGFIIPNFDSIIDFVNKASEVIPEVGYVGWDIAITNNGPIMIEGNNLPGYDLYQSKIHLNKGGFGLKPNFDEIIYGIKYKRDNKFWFFVSLWCSKISKVLLKLIRKKVPYFPGLVAHKICPNYLYYLSKPKDIISITGTNGKSTICKMLNDFFDNQNIPVINNNGFNTLPGITSFLTDSVTLFNKEKSQIAIIETDELTAKKIYDKIHPNYIIINNIFRDSIKRNANPEYITSLLKDAINSTNAKVLLNANDVLCTSIGNEESIYFGIRKLKTDSTEKPNMVCDGTLCPKCNHTLVYENYKYHHIGNYKCENCGFKTPKCKYEISRINDLEGYFILNNNMYNIKYPNIPNYYNALASISLLEEMGYHYKDINETFKSIVLLDTRFKKENINNKVLYTLMAKGQNPIAVSQALNIIKSDDTKKDVIIMLDDVNDRVNTCEIVSWLYDSDFEFLKSESINKIIIGGKRSKDYLLRLLFAGINKDKIITVFDEIEVVKQLKISEIDTIYLMHDIFAYDLACKVRENIIQKIRGES